MECSKIHSLISVYIDNQCSETEKTLVLTHIKECKECEKRLKQTVEMTQALRSLADIPLPDGYTDEIMQRVKNETQQPKIQVGGYLRRFGQVAAVIAISLSVLGGLNLLLTGIPYGNTGMIADDAALDAAEADTGMGAAGFVGAAVLPEPETEEQTYTNAANTEAEETRSDSEQTDDTAASMPAPAAEADAEPESGEGSSSRAGAAQTNPPDEANIAMNDAWIMSESGTQTLYVPDLAQKKIVRNIGVEIYVESLSDTLRIINTLPGYNAESHVNYYDPESDKMYGEAVIVRRLGVNEVVFAQGVLRGLGDVRNEVESQYELTVEYANQTVYARNSQNEITRLLRLVEQSDTLENIVYIESRIHEIDQNLDYHLGRIRQIDAQTRDVSINIQVKAFEPYIPEAFGNRPMTFTERISAAFSASVSFMRRVVEWFSVAVVSSVVPLALISLFALVIIKTVKAVKKRGVRDKSADVASDNEMEGER